MTVISLNKVADLALAPHMGEAFRQQACIVSTLKNRELASRPLLEDSPHGAVYVLSPNERVYGLCGFNIFSSVQCSGLKAVVNEVYLHYSLPGKLVGEFELEELFSRMEADGFNSFALEFHQNNLNAIQFYKSLRCRLHQSYNLMTLEM